MKHSMGGVGRASVGLLGDSDVTEAMKQTFSTSPRHCLYYC